MLLKEIITYIICFSLAVTCVNTTGIFQQVDNVDVNTSIYSQSTIDGVMEMDNGTIMSGNDVSNSLDGFGLVLAVFDLIKTMATVIIIPGPYLIDHGVDTMFALAVNVILWGVYIWGIMQYALNRPLGNVE